MFSFERENYARVENATVHIIAHAKFALTRGIETLMCVREQIVFLTRACN